MSDGVFPSHRSKTRSWRDEPPKSTAWVTDNGALPHPWRGDKADLPPFEFDVEGEKKPSTAFKSGWMANTVLPSASMRSVRSVAWRTWR